jgi:hypothetical protein
LTRSAAIPTGTKAAGLKRRRRSSGRLNFWGWVASTTSTTTRDGAQTKLLGDVRQEDGLGTVMIPLDHIVGPADDGARHQRFCGYRQLAAAR